MGEVFPDAKYQRCTVHFYRNVFSVVLNPGEIVAKMLKAIHAGGEQKKRPAKAKAVVAELRAMKLKEAAKKVEDGIETLTYCDFPSEHWTRIRTNNVIERLNREIRQRTQWWGHSPDGNSAPDAGLRRKLPPCGGHPVGLQKIHEHEALGSRLWTTPLLPADFIQPGACINNFAHKS